jgi:hypothetical protein
MTSIITALLAIQATNELANSALPNAPVRPDPPKRQTVGRLIQAARSVELQVFKGKRERKDPVRSFG